MKVYESSYNYDYPFPTVTLAYFLRYPNPYSRHVLSTDVIDRYVDPDTKRLHTLRLHLKKSKVPKAILSFLPRGLAGPGGASQSFILERSTIDINEGWMETESRNMEWTGILSVREHQVYKRRQPIEGLAESSGQASNSTTCKTTVTFLSRLGQAKAQRRKAEAESGTEQQEHTKQGFFAAWSTAGVQRTVELVGVKRTKTALINGKEGMNVVLERLRQGGVLAVLEGMRKDRLELMGHEGASWKQVWSRGASDDHE
jgi:4-amino-4-deoxychorismate lyase